MRLLILFFIVCLSTESADKIILGEGRWQYEFLPQAIQLPSEHAAGVQDYHGVAVDSKGRVFVGYYSKKTSSITRSVARFTYHPDSDTPFKFDKFLGDSSWVPNRIHGVNIFRNSKNEERLLLVYNKQQVIVCDLDGNIDKEECFNKKSPVFKKASDGHKSPLSDKIAVYDGYATNKLYALDKSTGIVTGHSHGAKGKGNDKTSTAHGIGVDPQGNYVIADRGNKRLVWRTPEFKPLMSAKKSFEQLQLATPGLEVCNVQFFKDAAVLPCLNAKIAFMEKSAENECGYEITSVLKMPAELIKKGYDGIHDVNFSSDLNYLIVAVWQRKRNVPPVLFALKRVAVKQ